MDLVSLDKVNAQIQFLKSYKKDTLEIYQNDPNH